jgi:anti-anti-sigma factor
MDIRPAQKGNLIVLELDGKLDAITSPQLNETFSQFVNGGSNQFVFDLSSLSYISSAGLRVMLTAAKSMKASSGQLVLAGVQGPVLDVFEMAGFTSLFQITNTVEEAVKLVGTAG